MSSSQASHPTLLIPGPIEFDDAVLGAMSHYSESHVSPDFIATFSATLGQLRRLFQTTVAESQPFLLSGSGTLGWDLVAVNLVSPGDDVLVLHSGYFADSFADCLETYGATATQLKPSAIGERPQLPEIEQALRAKRYAMLTVTHVDTSTGVRSELSALAELVRRVSPDTLLIVDGVCSVGCEELRFDEWQLDGVITASQKAIGCPAGLSISMFSKRAMERYHGRNQRTGSYYASMANWLPIMQAYEARQAAYFATPSPQLIHALHVSLDQVLSGGLASRIARHAQVSQRVKDATAQLGLRQLASDPANQANGMTAVYLPEGIEAADLVPKLLQRGVVIAGGLHKAIKTKYIRIGHMGISVMDPDRKDIDDALQILGEELKRLGHDCGTKA